MKIVRVEWEDSSFASVSGWHPGDSTIDPVRCTSVGIVQEWTKHKLVLVSCVSDSDQVGGLNVIPVSAIRKMRRLK